MPNDLFKLIIEIVILVACYLVGRYVTGNSAAKDTILDATSKMELIARYADMFVAWARQFLQGKSGSEKMDEVVSQLSTIAAKNGIDMSETEIQAIAQKAYDSMKAGETAATPTTVVAPVVSSDTVKESVKEVVKEVVTTVELDTDSTSASSKDNDDQSCTVALS